MILLLDNYDSFTYNLVGLLRTLGQQVVVRRSDTITPEEALALCPNRLVISPGPGRPAQTGNAQAIAELFWDRVPILGVCLGHQLLIEMAGGSIHSARKPMHGKTSPLSHGGRGMFAGLPEGTPVMRYHSLVADPATMPGIFLPTAWSGDSGELMAVQHAWLPIVGVQFHPESILTKEGRQMLANWISHTAGNEAITNLLTCTSLESKMGVA